MHADFSKFLFKWFISVRAKNLPIYGLILKMWWNLLRVYREKKIFLHVMEVFLHFKYHHAFVFKTVSGDSAQVENSTIEKFLNSTKNNNTKISYKSSFK